MAGLCFFYEAEGIDVWSGRGVYAWNIAAKAAGDIDTIIVVNRTTERLASPDARMNFQVVGLMPDLPNAVYCVGPGEKGSDYTSLWNFDHNVDWYCFGPATGWFPSGPKLHIPMASGAFHSVHAASVIMAHRYFVKGVH